MAESKLDLPEDLIGSKPSDQSWIPKASTGNDEDKGLMGSLDESKDQAASEIPLSPQWLYAKPNEPKMGNVTSFVGQTKKESVTSFVGRREYFSEAVEGVSSSTVTVEFDYDGGDGLIWHPLSANKLGFSQALLTYIKYPHDSLESCHVKVSIAQFPGIISSSGMPCSWPCFISFTTSVCSNNQEHSEVQTTQNISWNEENFKAHSTHPEDANLLASLCKLDITKENKPTTPMLCMETLSNEIACSRELLSSSNCKIGKLTLARLLVAHNTLVTYGCMDSGTEAHYEEILALYHDLMKMDSAHIGYYEDEYSLVLMKQLTSNTESLLKLCGNYQELSSPSISSYTYVRLKGLSLSRVSCMEHLLWVRMLDLSHNKLRSIEGLEALQLLSCLKLSNNKLSSFTALEPLKMLKSLQVLDVSYNEIGDHSIDTRRYMCSSPLNSTMGSGWRL